MSLVKLIPMVHRLAEIFESLRIKYAFGGALANNYWGTIRATQDIDVLLFMPCLRYEEVATALTEAGFTMLIENGNPAWLWDFLYTLPQDKRSSGHKVNK